VNAGRVGSYEPLIELASGGMGIVYVARKVGDAGFERLVVLKRVHRHLLVDPSFRKMLRDEARVLSLVHDAHVASVLDVVESEGELSLILEYVESLSLAALLSSARARGERLPMRIAVRIVSDALAGLHAAHAAVDAEGVPLELIHRDVSPQNIIVGLDGTSRLIDFGIAKATTPITDSRETEPTKSGVLKGKLRYMSPEQVRQAPLDRRSDVFSAGVVLYEALTGEKLFKSDDEGDLLLNLLLGDVKSPTAWVPDLPLELEAVVPRALARDREDRFATAGDFAEALDRVAPLAPTREVARYVEEHGMETLATRRDRIRAAARAVPTPSVPPPATRSEPPRDLPPPRRSVGVTAGALALLALAGGVGVDLVARRVSRAPPEVPSAASSPSEAASDDAAVAASAEATPAASSSAHHAQPQPQPQGSHPHAPRTAPDLHPNPYRAH
jgi:eukaryotic-like serine/threonine-protein kinase